LELVEPVVVVPVAIHRPEQPEPSTRAAAAVAVDSKAQLVILVALVDQAS
jgi:hypothetical protein